VLEICVNFMNQRAAAIGGFHAPERSGRAIMDVVQTNSWLPIRLAPEDCELELGQRGKSDIVPWHFPCRRKSNVWFNGWTGESILIFPTHFRSWRG
jgi:hypothetical protein